MKASLRALARDHVAPWALALAYAVWMWGLRFADPLFAAGAALIVACSWRSIVQSKDAILQTREARIRACNERCDIQRDTIRVQQDTIAKLQRLMARETDEHSHLN